MQRASSRRKSSLSFVGKRMRIRAFVSHRRHHADWRKHPFANRKSMFLRAKRDVQKSVAIVS